ncbi:MAG: sulfatase-like hydrolase/transferase [Halobacteriaceae archaeon]
MPDGPNVLFLMSDEHNPRFQGRLGEEPVETPAIDGIADRGADFENAYCPSPVCGPSRQCMLAGREMPNCGAWDNGAVMTADDTLPGSFRDAGYRTCLVGKMHFNGDRQFNGFEERPYGDLTGHGVQQPSHQPEPIHPDVLDVQPRRQGIETGTRIPGAGVTAIPESLLQEHVVLRETLSWLREHDGDDPWFLTASFSRPHFPLTAPRRHFERYWDPEADEPTDRLTAPAVEDGLDHPQVDFKRRRAELDSFTDHQLDRARAAYFACVEFLDEVLGELLATLDREGFLDDAVVVYASDHGDMAGEHGLWWKQSWHEGSSHVPLAVETPAHRAGERDPASVETPVSLLDLYPTLCGLAGVEYPDDLDGTDLSTAVRTGAEPDRGPVVCDTTAGLDEGVAFRMVRDGRYKYVGFRDAPEVLVDLEADPLETENLADGGGPADFGARDALDRLRAHVADTIDFDAVAEQYRADRVARGDHALPTPPGTGNAYLMPDGRLVDAATPLYQPDEIAWEPGAVYEDWPGEF